VTIEVGGDNRGRAVGSEESQLVARRAAVRPLANDSIPITSGPGKPSDQLRCFPWHYLYQSTFRQPPTAFER
jgi:hypothetical protein